MNAPEPRIGTTEELADAQTAHPTRAEAGPPAAESAGTLLEPADAAELARRWDDIQAGFVDQPRQAVSDADALVAELIQRLTRMFAGEHARLEAELDSDDLASTEDLRVGLQRYRDFFHRLLAT